MEQIKRYYIKASGSICYGKTGITFPNPERVDFEWIIKQYVKGRKNIKWSNQFYWTNQPPVICFNATQRESDLVALALPMCLIICEHWNQPKSLRVE